MKKAAEDRSSPASPFKVLVCLAFRHWAIHLAHPSPVELPAAEASAHTE